MIIIRMKNILTISLVLLLMSCGRDRTIEEIKADYGDFNNSTIKFMPIDYTKTPVYNQVKHHPEKYTYLDDVDIVSIGHMSDGLFITGLMVSPKKEGKYPVVILNRGGNRDLGTLIVATAVNEMAPLAAQGYVVVASNYRGNSRSEGKEEFGGEDVHDIKNLIKSMAEVEKADVSRIGLLGISRGGMMNLLTIKENADTTIKTIINIGGITDLETTIKYHEGIGEVVQELIPNFSENSQMELAKRSAIHWADRLPKNVPVLLLHGMKDDHVDYSQITLFADSLQKFNIPYKLISFENDDHGISNHKESAVQIISEWLQKYLKQTNTFQEANQREVIH